LKSFFRKKRHLWLSIIVFVVVFLGLVSYYLVYPRVLPQASIYLLDDAETPKEGQKVMVFSPHPDDETIGVGGYIAQSRKEGANVRIVLVTNGNKHHNENTRYAEFRKATGILGVAESELVFLNFPDGTLHKQSASELSSKLRKQLDDFNPDIVIYPHPKDFHPDHSTIGRIMEEILAEAPNKRIAYEYLVHYEFFYPRPKIFAPDLNLLPPLRLLLFDRSWKRFLLTEEVENLKQEALLSYQSQLKDVVLKELLLASIRKNELLAVPPILPGSP
jgi:LmbE family N-acetylglucosaminyl deacetylase